MNPIAPVVRRVEAAATTAVPTFLAALGLMYIMRVLVPLPQLIGSRSSEATEYAVTLITWGIPVLCVAIDGAIFRATYGMRKRMIRITRTDGTEVSGLRSFTRVLIGLALIPLSPISLICAIVDRDRRTLADRLCGTSVRMSHRDPDNRS